MSDTELRKAARELLDANKMQQCRAKGRSLDGWRGVNAASLTTIAKRT
jgi:hypothetical protein